MVIRRKLSGRSGSEPSSPVWCSSPCLAAPRWLRLAGLAIAALGLIWVNSRWVWLAFAVMLMAAWPLRSMPPVHDLLPKIEANSRDLYLYEDAISMTHVVQQQDGQRVLLSDLQRMDASTDPSAVEIQMDQARLALLLHPAPHSVLFLGLGTGISMAGSVPFPDLQRSAVELSQGSIVAAKHWFAPVNGNIMDQAQIQRDDARHFLSTTTTQLRCDHRRFVSSRSGRDGFFVVSATIPEGAKPLECRWGICPVVGTEPVRYSISQRGSAQFQASVSGCPVIHGRHASGHGWPTAKLVWASAMLANLHRLTVQEQGQATGGEGAWTWLGRYWGPISESSGPVQDEWVPYIEFRSAACALRRKRQSGDI